MVFLGSMSCLMLNFSSLKSSLAFVDVILNLVPFSKAKNILKAGEPCVFCNIQCTPDMNFSQEYLKQARLHITLQILQIKQPQLAGPCGKQQEGQAKTSQMNFLIIVLRSLAFWNLLLILTTTFS